MRPLHRRRESRGNYDEATTVAPERAQPYTAGAGSLDDRTYGVIAPLAARAVLSGVCGGLDPICRDTDATRPRAKPRGRRLPERGKRRRRGTRVRVSYPPDITQRVLDVSCAREHTKATTPSTIDSWLKCRQKSLTLSGTYLRSRVTGPLRAPHRIATEDGHSSGNPIREKRMLADLDARDRALFTRWALAGGEATARAGRMWVALTHMGGLTSTVSATLLPMLFLGGTMRSAAARAFVALVVSHAIVRLVKQFVGRNRPSDSMAWQSLVNQPACFSFPSGHGTASTAVAFVYSAYFPSLALPLMAFAVTIGFSRVRLGVHYPGDVLAGQCIALLIGLGTITLW